MKRKRGVTILGRVDGFDQDEAESKRDERSGNSAPSSRIEVRYA